MAKYVHADVLDNGLNHIKNNAVRMLLITSYTPVTDNYAAVVAKKVCEVVMTSGDYALSGADGAARVLTVTAKSGTASGNTSGTPNLHIAFTDNVSKVLMVTDETTDQAITSGNTVNFPSLTYTSGQPT